MISYSAFIRRTGLAPCEKVFEFWLFHTEKFREEKRCSGSLPPLC